MTFAQDIEAAFTGEPIEFVVIGEGNEFLRPAHIFAAVPQDKLGIPLAWSEARPMLDYKYDDGYGSAECHPVYVYGATGVGFVHEYDGSTGVYVIPRNPMSITPEYL